MKPIWQDFFVAVIVSSILQLNEFEFEFFSVLSESLLAFKR